MISPRESRSIGHLFPNQPSNDGQEAKHPKCPETAVDLNRSFDNVCLPLLGIA